MAAIRERFIVAASLMVLAGLCYPSAWFAALGLTLGLIVVAVPLGPAVVARRALWGLAGLSSIVVLGWYDLIAVNRVGAYFELQNQSGTDSLTLPGQEFLRLVFLRNTVTQQLLGRFDGAVLVVQAIVAVSLSGAAAVVTFARRHGGTAQAEIYPAAVGLGVTACLVFNSNAGAWDRSIVLAAPCMVCLRRAPLPLLVGILVVLAVTAALISRPFFLGAP